MLKYTYQHPGVVIANMGVLVSGSIKEEEGIV